jgi:hypothetical protein
LGELDTSVIRSLDDLARATREWAKDPSRYKELELRSPGLSTAELARLTAALPGLPASYLECLARFDLRHTSFSYFGLAPLTGDDFVQALLEANDPEGYLYSTYLAPNGLYFVAHWEVDPFCVARDLPGRPGGEVIGIDQASAAEPRLYRVAPTFAIAMLAAGSVLEARDDPAMAGAPGLDRFLSQLTELGLDEEQRNSWRYLIDSSGFWH